MNTSDPSQGDRSSPGSGPGPFSEQEVEELTAGPLVDPDVEELEPAEIDENTQDVETSFERLVQRSRKLTPERVRTAVESVLFVADRPLSLDQLFETTGIDREKIQDALSELAGKLQEGESGIVLHDVAGGWQLRTDRNAAEYVRRFLQVKPQRLTRAALETLAIIAYRQPVTRPEVEDIRGVDCGAVIKALLDRRLIKILGKKEEVGRPMLYGTTREFLEFFGLKDLASLPTLREFHELTEEHQDIVERETAKPTAEGTVAQLSDPTFQQKLEEDNRASEAALADLEAAITNAETKVKSTATFLQSVEPEPPPQAEPDGSKPS